MTGDRSREQLAPTHYEVLGLLPTATQRQIDPAYKSLVHDVHPDLDHSPGAHERMKRLNLAREVLGDPLQRRLYDAELRLTQTAAGLGRTGSPPAASAVATTTRSVYSTLRHSLRPGALLARLDVLALATWALFCLARFAATPRSVIAAGAPFLIVGTFGAFLLGFALSPTVERALLLLGGPRFVRLFAHLIAVALSLSIVLAVAVIFASVFDGSSDGIGSLLSILAVVVAVKLGVALARAVGKQTSRWFPQGDGIIALAVIADLLAQYAVLSTLMLASVSAATYVVWPQGRGLLANLVGTAAWSLLALAAFSGLGDASTKAKTSRRNA